MEPTISKPIPCPHPGGEPGEWECIQVVGEGHDRAVNHLVSAGWMVWANGKILDIPGAYLVRKIGS
jgi:hypothetical protein